MEVDEIFIGGNARNMHEKVKDADRFKFAIQQIIGRRLTYKELIDYADEMFGPTRN